MKINLFVLLLFSFINSISIAQRILKKKEVMMKLNKIQSEISKENFESAITIMNSKSEIILEKNVRKKYLKTFKIISSLLIVKEGLMKQNKNNVLIYKQYYDNNHLCEATKLLSLELSKGNSFIETQGLFQELKPLLLPIKLLCDENESKVSSCKKDYDNSKYCDALKCFEIELNHQNSYSSTLSDLELLLPNLKEAESKCVDFSEKIKKWQKQYDNKEYEKLFSSVLQLSSDEERFISNTDKPAYELLRKKIEGQRLKLQKKDDSRNSKETNISNANKNVTTDFGEENPEQKKEILDKKNISVTISPEKGYIVPSGKIFKIEETIGFRPLSILTVEWGSKGDFTVIQYEYIEGIGMSEHYIDLFSYPSYPILVQAGTKFSATTGAITLKGILYEKSH